MVISLPAHPGSPLAPALPPSAGGGGALQCLCITCSGHYHTVPRPPTGDWWHKRGAGGSGIVSKTNEAFYTRVIGKDHVVYNPDIWYPHAQAGQYHSS